MSGSEAPSTALRMSAGGLITESAGVAWVFVMLAGVAAAIVLTAVVLSIRRWREPAASGA